MSAAQPIFLDTEAVARRLGFDTATAFLRRRRMLEDEHGMPLPLPWWGRPLKWRADQIDHWISTQGAPRDADAPEIPPELLASGKVRMLAEARRV